MKNLLVLFSLVLLAAAVSWAQNTPTVGEKIGPDIISMTITPVSQISNEVVLQTTGFFYFAQKNPLIFMFLVSIIALAVIILLRYIRKEKIGITKNEKKKVISENKSVEIENMPKPEKKIPEALDPVGK